MKRGRRELMIYLARELLDQHGSTGRLTRLVDNARIFIMPSMNPDGYELHQRYNADNVDLNRNFPGLHVRPERHAGWSRSRNGRL